VSYTPPPPPPPPPGGAYPPPGGASAASPDPLGRPLAEGWERLVAGLIDGILIGVVEGIVSVALGNRFIGLGVGFVVAAAYYIVLNSATTKGQTVGKMVLGMATVDEATGNPLEIGAAAPRGLVQAALGWICCIGAIVEAVLIFTDPKRQTPHDKVGKTLVVKIK
jgi:uncharacterized RDD family membrane protein YckC